MLTLIHLYINEQRIAVTVNNCNNDDISTNTDSHNITKHVMTNNHQLFTTLYYI